MKRTATKILQRQTNLISPPQDETEQDFHFLSSLLCRPAFCRTPTVYLTCIHIRFPRSTRLCVHAHQAQMLIHGPLPRPAAQAAYRLTPERVYHCSALSPQPTHGASRALCLVPLVFLLLPWNQPEKQKKKTKKPNQKQKKPKTKILLFIASCCWRLFLALLLFLFCSLVAACFDSFTQKTDLSCSPFIWWNVW